MQHGYPVLTSRRLAVSIAALGAVALAAPMIAAEALYWYGVQALGPPPDASTRPYPPAAVTAFWLHAGERLPRASEPLSPWRYGWALAYNRGALEQARPGERIASLAARAWMGDRAPPRGLERALMYWAAAVWASRHMDADQLTHVWMDGAWFGRGARGIEAASSAYFGKPASELSIAEVALLVAMTPSPPRFSPDCAPESAVRGRARVLRLLLDAGAITAADHASAVDQPLGVIPRICVK